MPRYDPVTDPCPENGFLLERERGEMQLTPDDPEKMLALRRLVEKRRREFYEDEDAFIASINGRAFAGMSREDLERLVRIGWRYASGRYTGHAAIADAVALLEHDPPQVERALAVLKPALPTKAPPPFLAEAADAADVDNRGK